MNTPFTVDFIGIGSGKCGSTWLYENLVKHPKICDRNLKELNYFSDLYDEHPFDWYESQFAGCQRGLLKGEFSVTYLSHPKAAKRIHRHSPNAKILAIIREPVGRTFSNYLHSLRKGDISPSFPFSEYIKEEKNLLPARYIDYFRQWYDTFPRENIKVLVLEEFIKDMPSGYRDIYTFLGVDNPDFLPPDYDKRRNEARFYRFLWIENILVQTYRWLSRRGYTKLVKHILDSGVGELVRRINKVDRNPPKVDDASRATLKTYFHQYNIELSELLDRDLSCWDQPKQTR